MFLIFLVHYTPIVFCVFVGLRIIPIGQQRVEKRPVRQLYIHELSQVVAPWTPWENKESTCGTALEATSREAASQYIWLVHWVPILNLFCRYTGSDEDFIGPEDIGVAWLFAGARVVIWAGG